MNRSASLSGTSFSIHSRTATGARQPGTGWTHALRCRSLVLSFCRSGAKRNATQRTGRGNLGRDAVVLGRAHLALSHHGAVLQKLDGLAREAWIRAQASPGVRTTLTRCPSVVIEHTRADALELVFVRLHPRERRVLQDLGPSVERSRQRREARNASQAKRGRAAHCSAVGATPRKSAILRMDPSWSLFRSAKWIRNTLGSWRSGHQALINDANLKKFDQFDQFKT